MSKEGHGGYKLCCAIRQRYGRKRLRNVDPRIIWQDKAEAGQAANVQDVREAGSSWRPEEEP